MEVFKQRLDKYLSGMTYIPYTLTDDRSTVTVLSDHLCVLYSSYYRAMQAQQDTANISLRTMQLFCISKQL
ncbi:hypothetical protein GDO78_013427 [Eleutherodactylus coqui]|uniref:Uncharacterized protein n=1 Tax=Eleutherodactylus coqui TaxID=57060 RepID=A0A8J6EZR9_ELECQ|nr:hypothetical protein GDO78_013427 [Eleutherodactylus coqui]